jgi:hypothetical protein
MKTRLQDIREGWKETRVSIVSDGLIEITLGPIINILVPSATSGMLLKSHDTLRRIKVVAYLTSLFEEEIECVGHENVVQIITDSVTKNVLVGEMIEDEYIFIFLTPCVGFK